MGTSIAVTEQDYGEATDKSWIAVRDGLQEMRSITLDISTFSACHIASGVIPSGTALGRIAASGKYGPFSPYALGSNAIQSLVATGGSAGDFTLTFDGETTAAIAYNATAADVENALLELSNINPGDVDCTGGPLPTVPVVIEFGGQYHGVAVDTLTVVDNVTDGNATISVTLPGGAADGREVFAGHLFEACKVEALTNPDVGAALYWKGVVRWNRLPTFNWAPADEGGSGVVATDFMEDLVGDVGWGNHHQIRYEKVVTNG